MSPKRGFSALLSPSFESLRSCSENAFKPEARAEEHCVTCPLCKVDGIARTKCECVHTPIISFLHPFRDGNHEAHRESVAKRRLSIQRSTRYKRELTPRSPASKARQLRRRRQQGGEGKRSAPGDARASPLEGQAKRARSNLSKNGARWPAARAINLSGQKGDFLRGCCYLGWYSCNLFFGVVYDSKLPTYLVFNVCWYVVPADLGGCQASLKEQEPSQKDHPKKEEQEEQEAPQKEE